MSRTTNHTLMMLIAMLLSIQTAAAADKDTDRKKGLDAQQLKQIQELGQAVLTAKMNATTDPDMETLREKTKGLQQAITALDSSALSGGKIPSLSLKADGAPSSITDYDQKEKKERVKLQERENKVRAVLKDVCKQRSLVQAANKDDTGEHASVKRNAAAKVEELENMVEDLLNSRSEERAEKLKVLKERLTVKHSSQVAVTDTEKKTPTISTIVRHRAEEERGRL